MLWLHQNQNHREAGRITSIEKSNDLIGNRTHDLPACSAVPMKQAEEKQIMRVVQMKPVCSAVQ
jgi:hypothetical protein